MTKPMYKIALFPIPGSVTFPYTTVPLHVFEPRYRVLFREAQRQKMRVGICHTKKVIREMNKKMSLEEKLSSNLSSFEPYEIFSAGFPTIIDITDDGRMLVEIPAEERFISKKRYQDVPFLISECEAYEDDKPIDDLSYTSELRRKVDDYLLEFAKQDHEELLALLKSNEWNELTNLQYSFKVFQTIKLTPDLMQNVLEMRSPKKRLEVLVEQLQI